MQCITKENKNKCKPRLQLWKGQEGGRVGASSLFYSTALVWYFQYKLELACLDHRTSGASLGSIPTLSD